VIEVAVKQEALVSEAYDEAVAIARAIKESKAAEEAK
jgi:hypothetical protein